MTDMQKGRARSVSAIHIVGAVFTGLGSVYLILGGVLAWKLPENVKMVGYIFTTLGALFLLLGVIFLCVQSGKKRLVKRLVASGRFVWGDIVGLSVNHSVRVNGRYPIFLSVRFQDPYGGIHMFKSWDLLVPPDESWIGKKVKIYYAGDQFQKYYVATEDLTRGYIYH